MNTKEQLSGFIIAGGKSSRMGTDKATLLWNKKTFIQHIIDAFSFLEIELKLVSSLQNHKNLNIPIVEDIITDSGPVAGIASALTEAKTNINVIVSCDVPLINFNFINWLISNHNNDYNATIAMVNNKKMPLVGIYNKACLPVFLEQLKHKQFKLLSVLEGLNVNYINTPAHLEHCLFNVNTTNDLKSIS